MQQQGTQQKGNLICLKQSFFERKLADLGGIEPMTLVF